jgi:hypothetical protein
MKTFLLSSLIFVSTLILIIIFQNIGNYINGDYILFYYYTQNDNPASFISIIAGLGFIAGVLATALATSIVNESKDEEAPGGSNW